MTQPNGQPILTPEQLEEIQRQIDANASRDNLRTVELIRDYLKKKNNEPSQNKDNNDK
jgi:hypothetical protein